MKQDILLERNTACDTMTAEVTKQVKIITVIKLIWRDMRKHVACTCGWPNYYHKCSSFMFKSSVTTSLLSHSEHLARLAYKSSSIHVYLHERLIPCEKICRHTKAHKQCEDTRGFICRPSHLQIKPRGAFHLLVESQLISLTRALSSETHTDIMSISKDTRRHNAFYSALP